MKSHFGSKLKTISLVLVASFILEQFGFASPADLKPLRLDIFAKQKPFVDLELPESVARVEDSFDSHSAIASTPSQSRNDLLVYLLQDAHTNPSGQDNLAKTIETILNKEEGV